MLARERDLGEALASNSTMNRLELTLVGRLHGNSITRSAIVRQRSMPCWLRKRRVIARAEQIEGQETSCYLVTSLGAQD